MYVLSVLVLQKTTDQTTDQSMSRQLKVGIISKGIQQ